MQSMVPELNQRKSSTQGSLTTDQGTSCPVWKLGESTGGWASVSGSVWGFIPLPLFVFSFHYRDYNLLFQLLSCSYVDPQVLHFFLILPSKGAAVWHLVAG